MRRQSVMLVLCSFLGSYASTCPAWALEVPSSPLRADQVDSPRVAPSPGCGPCVSRRACTMAPLSSCAIFISLERFELWVQAREQLSWEAIGDILSGSVS